MFSQGRRNIRTINDMSGRPQRTGDPQLFLQTALCRLFQRFTTAGMTTAAVGPQSAGMVFAERALLDQQLTRIIKQEHRKRTVQ